MHLERIIWVEVPKGDLQTRKSDDDGGKASILSGGRGGDGGGLNAASPMNLISTFVLLITIYVVLWSTIGVLAIS